MYDMENCGHFLKFGLFQNLSDFSSEKLEEMYTCKNRFCPFVLGEDLGSYLLQGYKILDAIRQKENLRYIFLTLTVQKSKIRRYSFNNFSYE